MANADAVTKVVLEELLPEIERYLRVVDAFRREGVEPTWGSDRRRLTRESEAPSFAHPHPYWKGV
jgi:hypothetical protein